MKRALLVTLVLACLAAPSAWGQQFSRGHRQAAGELLDLLKVSQDLTEAASTFVDAQVAADPNVAPFRDVLLEWMGRYLHWDVIGPQISDLYMRTFTEAELRDLIAFYKTPTGRKSLEKMPEVMQESFRLGQEIAEQHKGELQTMIQARVKELARARPGSSVSPNAAEQLAQGWLARANQFYDKGQWEEAKNAFLEYLEESPEDVRAMADLGVCYKELGDYNRALRNFDRALVLDPGHWQALYNKIIVLGFHVGKKDEAKKLMRDLRRQQPTNPDVARLAQDVAKL
ncbi:MAG TPA: DUF2059 domain-containing protein [Thermoanaerobaculia bacterium]|nr:DUF2059 domain-containing protein [Thermoanaerobaculia bacterium]